MLAHAVRMHEQRIRREEGGAHVAVFVSASQKQAEAEGTDQDRTNLLACQGQSQHVVAVLPVIDAELTLRSLPFLSKL